MLLSGRLTSWKNFTTGGDKLRPNQTTYLYCLPYSPPICISGVSFNRRLEIRIFENAKRTAHYYLPTFFRTASCFQGIPSKSIQINTLNIQPQNFETNSLANFLA